VAPVARRCLPEGSVILHHERQLPSDRNLPTAVPLQHRQDGVFAAPTATVRRYDETSLDHVRHEACFAVGQASNALS
jgi:hypothetical protein